MVWPSSRLASVSTSSHTSVITAGLLTKNGAKRIREAKTFQSPPQDGNTTWNPKRIRSSPFSQPQCNSRRHEGSYTFVLRRPSPGPLLLTAFTASNLEGWSHVHTWNKSRKQSPHACVCLACDATHCVNGIFLGTPTSPCGTWETGGTNSKMKSCCLLCSEWQFSDSEWGLSCILLAPMKH